MNISKAAKLLVENVGCGLLSSLYDTQKNLVFVSTQLYETFGYKIINGQPPVKIFQLTGHTAAVDVIVKMGQ